MNCPSMMAAPVLFSLPWLWVYFFFGVGSQRATPAASAAAAAAASFRWRGETWGLNYFWGGGWREKVSQERGVGRQGLFGCGEIWKVN